jgi:carbamoyl-phosphate synthase small subunit
MADVAKLALEDGTVYTGRAFGARGEKAGEVVFNTSMTGYQEVLTDPSYKGQVVTMTYPLIGNYGINPDDRESRRPQVEGFIVRELTRIPSNYRSQKSLDDYLRENHVLGLEGIDTRALVRRLRVRGAMKGVLSSIDLDDASLVHKARTSPGIVGRDLVREVVPERSFAWTEGFVNPLVTYLPARPAAHHVVALDYGMKWNILRCLVQVGCRVTVLPGTASADEVLAHKPDGIFLSNGPGDPAALGYAISVLRTLAETKPIFGICLGHHAEPRLRRPHRQPAARPGADAHQPQRSHTRRDAPSAKADLQCTVSSRSVGGSARQRVSIRAVSAADGVRKHSSLRRTQRSQRKDRRQIKESRMEDRQT